MELTTYADAVKHFGFTKVVIDGNLLSHKIGKNCGTKHLIIGFLKLIVTFYEAGCHDIVLLFDGETPSIKRGTSIIRKNGSSTYWILQICLIRKVVKAVFPWVDCGRCPGGETDHQVSHECNNDAGCVFLSEDTDATVPNSSILFVMRMRNGCVQVIDVKAATIALTSHHEITTFQLQCAYLGCCDYLHVPGHGFSSWIKLVRGVNNINDLIQRVEGIVATIVDNEKMEKLNVFLDNAPRILEPGILFHVFIE